MYLRLESLSRKNFINVSNAAHTYPYDDSHYLSQISAFTSLFLPDIEKIISKLQT